MEAQIPEDDPRNPAVIADLVGDNVGDCAGRGADLFESIAAEIISAMILGGTLADKAIQVRTVPYRIHIRRTCTHRSFFSNIHVLYLNSLSSSFIFSSSLKIRPDEHAGFVIFPLVVHAFDLVVSSMGVFSVNCRSVSAHNDSPAGVGEPLAILKRGYKVASLLAIATFFMSCSTLLSPVDAPDAWWHFMCCGLVGMVAGWMSVQITTYYTATQYRPVRSIGAASNSGHATNIIAGISVGLESTALPILVISIAILASFWLGSSSGLTDRDAGAVGGLFGTAVATMGMLSTAVYVLAMDFFGPIADNAGGIVEMSDEPESVRDITDLLDAVGNTTKAATKGFAIGSAALACFLLFSAYVDEVEAISRLQMGALNILAPEVFVPGLLGSMLVFLFSALTIRAVGDTAQEVVQEVRRQFRIYPGIMTGEEQPDYTTCVAIVAKASLRKMVKPGLLACSYPLVLGLIFRWVGESRGEPLMGARAVLAVLVMATITGVLMSLFLNNAGGAWDNAKKLIETGQFGGKASEAHKASVTGDTVGDPFKDTAGPSIHVLIKLLATISLVLAPLVVSSNARN